MIFNRCTCFFQVYLAFPLAITQSEKANKMNITLEEMICNDTEYVVDKGNNRIKVKYN